MRRATTRLNKYFNHLCPPPRHFFRSGTTSMLPSSSEITNGNALSFTGVSLEALPKSHIFAANLPPDPLIPSPEVSKTAPKQHLRSSRPVKNALFTWVAPEPNENPQLLATSPAAVAHLGLDPKETKTKDFLDLMSGNKFYEQHYPWGNGPVLAFVRS